MPNRDKQGPPEGTGPRTGRDMGPCGKDKGEIIEKKLERNRGKGCGPCGGGGGRRKGPNGITYFT